MPDDATGMHGVFHGLGGFLLSSVVVDQFNFKGVRSFKRKMTRQLARTSESEGVKNRKTTPLLSRLRITG